MRPFSFFDHLTMRLHPGQTHLIPQQMSGGQPKSLNAEGAEEKRKGRYDTLCDLCETSASSALRLLPLLVLPVR